MRFLWLAAALVGTLGAAAGCSGDDTAPPIDEKGGSGGKTAGVTPPSKGGTSPVGDAGAGGEGGRGGEIEFDPLGPVVTITSPEQLDDPNEGGVLVGQTVEVTCLVKQSEQDGSEKVDTSSVKIARLENGEAADEKDALAGSNAGEFKATFALAEADWGRIQFSCTAASTDDHLGSGTVATFLDKGPIITFSLPVQDAAYPLASLFKVEFKVEPAQLTDDDEQAGIAEVGLSVAGVKIEDLSAAEVAPGSYSLELNLADKSLFNPTPAGPIPVEVSASNQREPEPVEARQTQTAIIDGDGPVIAITSPTNKAVIGGKVVLTFTATDAVSGVDPGTVHVSLNQDDEFYDPANDAWGYQNSVFTYEFDSRQVEGSLVQVTVNIGATDKVGNKAAGATELLYLDNHPPLLDLDPLPLRTMTLQKDCSTVFDPVGDAATNDATKVNAAAFLRAMIWEETNEIDEIPVKHIAGVNPATVRVYVRRESDGPLLVDKFGNDGVCDEVVDVDSGDSLELTALARGGTQWISTGDETEPPAMSSLGCKNAAPLPPVPPPTDEPQHLCTDQASDMWQVIGHEASRDGVPEPAIYSYGPTAGLECTGVAWEFTNKFQKFDGWACFAARAVDYAGNVGVSRPLRVCVDYPDVAGTPACAVQSAIPPTCADACTPPPQIDIAAVRW